MNLWSSVNYSRNYWKTVFVFGLSNGCWQGLKIYIFIYVIRRKQYVMILNKDDCRYDSYI